ncbi:MAG TPA: galactokinase [Armatimonadetes bacterium]|nr:galactokinase [Armatimonadota bacterium]
MVLVPQDTVFSMILAGGRGTRMRSDTKHKACFEVAGVPVILRALQVYEDCGIEHHVIVIGELGEQVVETAGSRFPDVTFAYQPQPLGTGNAARCGARVLEATGFDGRVFVVAGDRLLRPQALKRLIEHAEAADADLQLLVGDKADNPTSGRVVYQGNGQVAGIVETSEIGLSRVVADLRKQAEGRSGDLSCGSLLEIVHEHLPNPKKAAKACGELYSVLTTHDRVSSEQLSDLLDPLEKLTTLRLRDGSETVDVPASEVDERTDDVNLSSYLFRAEALYEGLRHLDRDNAQGEEYITDAIRALVESEDEDGRPRFSVTTVKIEHPDDALAFNTPEELAAVERTMRAEVGDQALELVENPRFLHERSLRTVKQWQQLFTEDLPETRQFMEQTYGALPQLHETKRQQYLDALQTYAKNHSADDKVFIVRSPGRINLLGRHIDHRGGRVNVVAIDDEIILVASPRDDDVIDLRNCNRLFRPAKFSIHEEISHLDWGDWLNCVNSPKTLAMVSNGHWENYVKAAALRLQSRFKDRPLQGLNIVTHGSIPLGSGLSSSSAIVVAAAEAMVSRNGLPVRANLLVDLCGEGEWFVGTRGGNGDHAAIKFGRRGLVAHIGFFPFEVYDFLPFFADHRLVVCNSGISARKSESARGEFNRRILGYVAGELILRQLYPAFAGSIHHLRDVSCSNLGMHLDELYGMVKRLPERITVAELLSHYGRLDSSDWHKLHNLLSGLDNEDEPFDVRGVTLFGMAECERSLRCTEHLRTGDADGFGALWYASHDGDRVVSHDTDLQQRPWEYEVSDRYLDGLIADIRSSDPDRVERAQLHRQPGMYRCSTPEMDLIVDAARSVPGVKGAQLAGAGLGGSAMILVEEDAVDPLIERLATQGFEARPYCPPEGAGMVIV